MLNKDAADKVRLQSALFIIQLLQNRLKDKIEIIKLLTENKPLSNESNK